MKNTASNKPARDFRIDLLRVLACYLVIQQHASEFFYIGPQNSVVTGDNTLRIGIITSIARISVPLFVMISGYLLLPMRTGISEFFKKRFSRILIPFIVWCILYALYFMVTRGDSWGQAFTNILHIPVNFGVEVGHLWYVYMLIGLYLLIPVLSPWVADCSRRVMQGYLLLWSLTTLLPYIHLVFPQVWGECFWNPTPAFYYFSGFAGYLILGCYIRKFGALSIPQAVAMTLAGYALTAGIFILRIGTAETIPQLELSWGFATANIAMMSYGIFSLFMHLHADGQSRIGRRIRDISVRSYGMYLAHIMVLNLFYQLLNPLFDNTLIAVPLIAVCSFLTVYAAVRLLALLPKSKYWLG